MDLSSSGESDFLIYRHLRMSLFKIIVQEGDMPYDPETVL